MIHIRRTTGALGDRHQLGLNRRPHRRRADAADRPRQAGDTLLQAGADPTGALVFGTLKNDCGQRLAVGTCLDLADCNQYFGALNTLGTLRNAAQYTTASGFERHRARECRQYVPRSTGSSNRTSRTARLDRRDRPLIPRSTPKKRTALGRMKHENAAYGIGATAVVVYIG